MEKEEKYKKEVITEVYRSEKDRDGKEFIGKDGIPYSKISIKIERLGNVWLSGYGSFTNYAWNKGDIVQIEVIEGEYKGKKTYDFKNFRHPMDSERRKMWEIIIGLQKGGKKENVEEKETETIDPEDIPF